jgi:hypothetical protein
LPEADEEETMTETLEDGAPFFFATQQPPTATAIDEDIYLTVTAEVPTFPGQVETIDIILSVDFARHVIAQLSGAVARATRNDAS